MIPELSIEAWIPALGQQEALDEAIRFLVEGKVFVDTEVSVIDNGSNTPLLAEKAYCVIRNEENLGMVGSLRQAIDNTDTDILLYLHSDMYVYEPGWDAKIIQAFEEDPKLAALGVVGAVQADANGGRSGTVCAFRDGHLHGTKPTQQITPVALLDGCFQCFKTSVLRELDWSQLEEDGYFHGYDKDLTLTLTMQSHHVAVINLDCQHLGGQTSCRPEFQDSLKAKGIEMQTMYNESEARYINRWKHVLPVHVTPEYVVHVGRSR